VNNKAALEGLLFVVGDDGLTLNQLSELLEINNEESKMLINELKEDYAKEDRGITINYLGNTFKLTTKEEHKKLYEKLIESPYSNILSQAALETLAIIAYNEPVTRIKVDEVRGVASVNIVRKLLAKGFVKEVGRADQPGRPILYETTNEFLDYFGLKTIEDLPELKELTAEDLLSEEQDLFNSKYHEEIETIE